MSHEYRGDERRILLYEAVSHLGLVYEHDKYLSVPLVPFHLWPAGCVVAPEKEAR